MDEEKLEELNVQSAEAEQTPQSPLADEKAMAADLQESESLARELQEAIEKRDEYLAMAQRTQADFNNFRRRNQQIRTEAYDEGVRDTLAAMLPVVDNLQRALAAAEESEDDSPLAQGVRMTEKQMMDAMEKLGLEEVPAEGQRFDPELHNAVMRADEGEAGTILEVFQKGYRVRGKIIRYAMVKVSAD